MGTFKITQTLVDENGVKHFLVNGGWIDETQLAAGVESNNGAPFL